MYPVVLVCFFLRLAFIKNILSPEIRKQNLTVLQGWTSPSGEPTEGSNGYYYWFDGGDFPGGGGPFHSLYSFLDFVLPKHPIEALLIDHDSDPLAVALKEMNEEHYVAQEILNKVEGSCEISFFCDLQR